MRVCPSALALVGCVLTGACHESSSSGVPVLASSRIGPAGGVLLVESGHQAGLILTVDPGVLTEVVDFRIRDHVPEPLPPGAVSSWSGQPQPFSIEPQDLVLSQEVRLRMPYRPLGLWQSGPGNVVVNQVSPFTVRNYDPDNLSINHEWVEIGVKTFGQFSVRQGRDQGLLDYTPPLDEVVMLTDGYQFVVEQEPAMSPFGNSGAQQWHLTGPGFDESVIFANGLILGRRSAAPGWLEIWGEPYDPYHTVGGSVIPQPGIMEVQSPIGAPGLGASVMLFGIYAFTEPVEYNGGLQPDVMRLAINVAYNRADLGSGERQMTYWLSPIEGLLAVMVDGVVYDRIP